MTRDELMAAVEAAKTETKEALQLVYDALNYGQQQKIVNNELIRKLFDRYKVQYNN